jgi:hypothetical protein
LGAQHSLFDRYRVCQLAWSWRRITFAHVTQDATHGRVFLSGRITLEPPLAVDSNTPSARFPRLAQGSLAQSDAIDPLRADCTTPAADAA